jgi:3-isopropylmalate/(R)-2-methylmalate dehydratase small subunit
MLDLGIRVVIAPSFSDIHSGNSVKNGILPVVLPQEAVDRLLEVAREGLEITVDLEQQTVTTPYQDRFTFNLDPFRRHCLLNGLDEVGLTMARGEAIGTFEAGRTAAQPWLMRGTAA